MVKRPSSNEAKSDRRSRCSISRIRRTFHNGVTCRISNRKPGRRFSAPRLEGFHKHRQQRQKNNAQYSLLEVPADNRDPAELIADRHHEGDPKRPPEQTERQKTSIRHLSNPRNKWRAGTDNRNEPRVHNRAGAVLLVKRPGAFQMVRMEKKRFRAAENSGAGMPAEEIADVIADDRGAHEDSPQQVEVHAGGATGKTD